MKVTKVGQVRRQSALFFLGGVAAVLMGCAASNVSPQSAEEVVKQRSDAFWQARSRDDAQAAYLFTSPSYRQVYDVKQFRIDYAGKSMASQREIVSVQCDTDYTVCTVKQKLQAFFPFLNGLSTDVYVDETWLKDEGQWWVFKK